MQPTEPKQGWWSRRLGPFGVGFLVLALGAYWLLATAGAVVSVRRGQVRRCDFIPFYAAGRLAAEGDPVAPYDPEKLYQAERRWVDAELPWKVLWHYPPPYYLWLRPLVAFEYHAALLLWVLFNLGLFTWVTSRLGLALPDRLLLLAAPALLVNAGYGQNGAVNMALLYGGLALRERSPYLAGGLLGSLVYKPQLAVLAPLGLLAEGRYRVVATTASVALAWCLVATACYGLEPWAAFLAEAGHMSERFRAGLPPLQDMYSVLAMVMLGAKRLVAASGGEVSAYFPLAQGLQLSVSALAVLGVLWVWSGPGPEWARRSAVAIGAVLASPWGCGYDLVLVTIALAEMGAAPDRADGGRLEAAVLLAAWLMPILGPFLAKPERLGVNPTSLVHLLLFACLLRHVHAARSLAPAPADA